MVTRRYACGRCDRTFKRGEERLHSDWSGLSYCLDIDACGRRAKRWTSRPEMVWKPSERSLPPRRKR